MDISSYKFFVGTGCSYGRHIDSLFNFSGLRPELLQSIGIKNQPHYKGEDEVIFLNVSGPSQGSDWQSDSVIYTVSKLLKLGAKKENIFCLVEWSEYQRTAFPFNKFDEIEDKWLEWKEWAGDGSQGIYRFHKHFAHDRYTCAFDDSDGIVDYLKSNLKIYSNNENTLIRLEETEYMNAAAWYDSNAKKWPNFYIMYENFKNIQESFHQEFLINRYIDNILRLQWFLKLHNIEYTFYNIYSQFSGWYIHHDGNVAKHFHSHDSNMWFKDTHLIKERFKEGESTNIEDIYTAIKPKFDLIDLDNFWFHNTKHFERGGVDEWTIDTFGESGYGEFFHQLLNDRWGHIFKGERAGLTAHPGILTHFVLFSEVSKKCKWFSINEDIIKILMECYEKDKNSESISETGFWVSDKWYPKVPESYDNNPFNTSTELRGWETKFINKIKTKI